jgi:alanyl-tRNA synthetase
MDAQSLRDRFVEFYVTRGHTLVPPAPLVPRDDPSLLFTSAGMVQFKRLYSTTEPLPYARAVTVQPCLRAGGKDSDIENVGRTPRHLSFFEMLGNFSFGDYFKEQAIAWGWEFLTKELGLDPGKLWVSVYVDDDEAAGIWRSAIGLPETRIVRLGRKDNFWGPAGKTGACGPCSEIYFDLGPEHTGAKPGDDGDRYFEIYNLVFPQFDMQEDGTLASLRNRGIDTGMGLERLTQVVQGVPSVFDTDLFQPILERFGELAGVSYEDAELETKRAMRVVADHARGLTFTIAEGVMPSNEGRGYVMRRILRRAARRGFALGIEGAFLDTLSGVVIDHYQRQYPLLRDARERVALALRAEEERFETTLGTGMARFESAVERARRAGSTALAGDEVFTLYDTFGFPVDLLREMAEEKGLAVDETGFQAAMETQRKRSRAASRFVEGVARDAEWTVVAEGPHSRFVGYDGLAATGHLRRYAREGGELAIVLDVTPFYAESGGQVGDTGTLRAGEILLEVADTRRAGDAIVHTLAAPDGFDPAALAGRPLEASVDAERRAAIARNHTATHLLHAALRTVLGTHVTQAGSLVAPDRLRFDFTHFQAMTPDEVCAVEEIVAREIVRASPVETTHTSLKDALAAGAMALFGEKYGETVRQVVVPGVSRELCGGTHVATTGAIGPFLIVQETGVAAGTRRIEAVTGLVAAQRLRTDHDTLSRLAGSLGTGRDGLEEKIAALVAERARLEKELAAERSAQRKTELGRALDGVEDVRGVRFVVRRIEAKTADEMRQAADVVRELLGSGVAILGADTGGKASFLALVTKDLADAKRLRADEIVREVAKVAGGSGGGKPDIALAGAKDVSRIDEALRRGREFLLESLR